MMSFILPVERAPHTPKRIWILPSSVGKRGSMLAFCSFRPRAEEGVAMALLLPEMLVLLLLNLCIDAVEVEAEEGCLS